VINPNTLTQNLLHNHEATRGKTINFRIFLEMQQLILLVGRKTEEHGAE
jgi:hypothetical protein